MADRPAVGSQSFVAPHPGSKAMPRWNTAELIDAPRFTWRNWAAMIGPGLLMGGAAIGGGEWLTGPLVTARYGGNMLWLATLSIVFQVIYNLEICRYTLYTGEPIFTGKFRTPPGPAFWLLAYIALDFGALFPYLAASAATPVAMLILRELPDPQSTELVSVLGLEMTEKTLLKVLGNAIFLLALVPLIFGGKIYNSLRAVMTFKIVTVFGFLLVLGALYTGVETWIEITTGFFKFGMVPIQGGEHAHSVDNVFLALFEGRGFPIIDFTTIGLLCAMVAISGQGGLSNTPLSNYTRDQGWGMGHHVGAIPSVVGGHRIKLSHVGSVFEVTADSLSRWRRWYRHVMRDQLVIWMPACFIGLALPSILSVEFLPRGTEADPWTAAGMTAGKVGEHVTSVSGPTIGGFFWFMTVFCGFLVLAPSMSSSADGVVRRWLDVLWTGSAGLRQVDPRQIGKVYFGVLCGYAVFGLLVLTFVPPGRLLIIATNIFNYALGFSCWHALAVNLILLPRELRPCWAIRISLFVAGAFFMLVAGLTTYHTLARAGWI